MYGLVNRLIKTSITVRAVIHNMGYRIIQITEEETPLAPGADDRYLYLVIGAMIVVLLLLSVAVYGILCYRCRQRIAEYDEDRAKKSGWLLWRLKETVAELEADAADEAMKGIVF